MAYDPFEKIARANSLKNNYGGLIKEGTESVYNMQSSPKEQGMFDSEANRFLSKMYQEDLDAGIVRDLDYRQYLKNLTGDFFRERVDIGRSDDPTYYKKAGDLFFNVYEGDFDQFRESAARDYVNKEKV